MEDFSSCETVSTKPAWFWWWSWTSEFWESQLIQHQPSVVDFMWTRDICWPITKEDPWKTPCSIFLPQKLHVRDLSSKASFYFWLHFQTPNVSRLQNWDKEWLQAQFSEQIIVTGSTLTKMLSEMTKSIGFNKAPPFSLTFSALAQARKQHIISDRILRFSSLVQLSNGVTKKKNLYKKSTFFKYVFNGKKASQISSSYTNV